MTARKYFIVSTILLALLVGCAASQGGLFGRPKVDKERQAKLTERLRIVDIDWEILGKDNPPQAQTVDFRRDVAEATKAMEAGDLDTAEKKIAAAEQWIGEARPRYFRDHETNVVAGKSNETASAMMAAAISFKDKGLKAKAAGDQTAADRYLRAAIEEGELAIVTSGRSGESPEALARLVNDMGTIYTAAGHPERATQLRARVIKALQEGIDQTGKQIEQRLKNNAPGFEPALLKKDKAALPNAMKELYTLNDQYQRQVADANAFAPGEIKSMDYAGGISFFYEKWRKIVEGPQLGDGNTVKKPPVDDGVCITKLKAHNQLKAGAASVQGSGIVIEETEVYVEGARVIIRGKIQNLRTTPILEPKVTITGGVMSMVKPLDYASMSPMHSTTFILALECYTIEAYNRSMNSIPAHDILLIFKEPNGTERKIIQTMGTRTGG